MRDLIRLYRFVRLPVRSTAAVTMVALLVCTFASGSPPAQAQADTPVPAVQGPITGPGPMFNSLSACESGCPSPAPRTTMSDFNYVTEEYFVSGIAGGSPYKTRVVVRRPAFPERFSGLVVAEPMHFSGAALICQYAQLGIAESGDACLEIDAEPVDLSLLDSFNSARYDSLSLSSAQTDEVLAQVGRLVRSNGPGSPFAGLLVRDVVLSGISESSDVARGYMSAYDQGVAGFRRLAWVAYGVVPPHAPYIAVNPGNQVIDGTRVALDQYGNPVGGVRTPYLDVPLFRYTIPNYDIPGSAGPSFLCSLAGYQTPLPQGVLQGLYKNEGQYISAVNHDLQELTSEGWWPEQYTEPELRADALSYAKALLAPTTQQG